MLKKLCCNLFLQIAQLPALNSIWQQEVKLMSNPGLQKNLNNGP